MKHKKRTVRSTLKLTTLDDFLKDQGKLEEFEAVATKEATADATRVSSSKGRTQAP